MTEREIAKKMSRKLILMVTVLLPVLGQSADLYFDNNGAAAGFGIDAASNFLTDPGANTWNTDSTGGSGGSLTTVSSGDILHFGLEGTGAKSFNWTNYAGVALGGIHTYQTTGSTAHIGRMQKTGATGGPESITWSAGAAVETTVPNGFWWNLGTTGDFTKTGSSWLRFGDGFAKVDGTCTVSNGYIVLRRLGTVGSSSSFRMTGLRQIRISSGLSGTATMGQLIGGGSIVQDGGGSNELTNVVINTAGVVLTNSLADSVLSIEDNASLVLSGSSESAFDIAKVAGVTTQDMAVVTGMGRSLTVNGKLTVRLLPGDALAMSDSFQLFNASDMAGSFTEFDLPDISGSGLGWDTTQLGVDGTLRVTAAPKYLDLNGVAPGFGLSSTNGNGAAAHEIDFDYSQGTNWSWTADVTGTSGHGALNSGEVAHFRLSGSGGILFEFLSSITGSGVQLGGIQVSREPGSTATVGRFQQDNEGGGSAIIEWAPNAVVDASALWFGFWWNLGTTNDYTKEGSQSLEFGDGRVKVGGTLTIAGGEVKVTRASTVDETSSFHLDGGNLALHAHASNAGTFRDETKSIGKLSGSGSIISSGGVALTNTVLVLEDGIDMADSDASDEIQAGWGLSLTLGSSATSKLDIAKSGGSTTQDVIRIDWPDKTLTVFGGLEVNLLPGSDPIEAGDSFKILDAGTIAGSFSSVALPDLTGTSLFWNTGALETDGVISVEKLKGFVFSIR